MEPFNSRRAPAYAPHGMVASSQPLAAQVGLQVLKDDGNAVDAAIAMAAMVNVTEPMMNGLGGDAFILVYWQGKLHGLNARGRCPQTMTGRTFLDAGWKRMPQAGWGSVSVPGAPDGYFALHERFGSKNVADLIEPAAAYAEEGFAVGQKIAQVWEWGASKLRLSEHAMEEYLQHSNSVSRMRSDTSAIRASTRLKSKNCYPTRSLVLGNALRITFGCMGANMQPQGQVQILINLIDRGMNLQEAIDAPRVRALGGSRISVEQTLTADVITRLASLGMISFPERKFPATGSSPTTLRAVSKEALKLSPSTRNSTPSAVLPIRGSMAWPLGTKNANKRAICFRVYSRSTHCSRCARRWLPFAWEQTANAFGTSFSGMRWPYFAGPGVFGVLNQFAKSAEYRNPRNPANLGPFLYLSSLPRFRLFHWARSYG